jgi:hypothetical protein
VRAPRQKTVTPFDFESRRLGEQRRVAPFGLRRRAGRESGSREHG